MNRGTLVTRRGRQRSNARRRADAHDRSRTKRIRTRILTVVSSIFLVLFGAAIAYELAPGQGVDTQRAIDQDRTRQDRNASPVAVTTEPLVHPGFESLGFDTAIDLRQLQPLVGNPYDSQVRVLAASRIIAANYDDVSDLRGRQTIHFSLTGQHFATVDVKDIVFRITARRLPPNKAVLWIVPQGESDVGNIGFDLDSSDVRARVVDRLDLPTKEDFFDHKQVTLTKDEPFRFVASVIAREADYDFVLEVHFTDGTNVVVDDNGKPWTVAAYSPSYSEAFTLYEGSPGLQLIRCQWPLDCRRGHY